MGDTFPHQLLQIASACPLGAVLPGLHALINYEPPAMERFPRTSVAPVKTVASGVLLFQRSHENYYFCFADNEEQEISMGTHGTCTGFQFFYFGSGRMS